MGNILSLPEPRGVGVGVEAPYPSRNALEDIQGLEVGDSLVPSRALECGFGGPLFLEEIPWDSTLSRGFHMVKM